MCDGHTASVMKGPERDYLREKGRRTRRECRAKGKLPGCWYLWWCGSQDAETDLWGKRSLQDSEIVCRQNCHKDHRSYILVAWGMVLSGLN